MVSFDDPASQNSKTETNYIRMEGRFTSFDSTPIFYQGWKPLTDAKAVVIITHGQGEHSECYHRVVRHFAGKGFEFWAWDLRGHGRSDGIRGYAPSFSHYIRDYQFFINMMISKIGGRAPIFLLAHSMGGLVQMSGLLDLDQEAFKAQVLSAPLFGVAVPVPAFKRIGAEYLEKFLPKLTLSNEIGYDMVTRVPEFIREFEKDPLRHDKISSGVYLGFLRQINSMMEQADKIHLSTLFQCPEKDPVCSTEATLAFSQKMNPGLVKFLEYGGGARHEMYNDLHREEVYRDLEKFLLDQLDQGKGRD
jgi:lysophospholipase